MFAFSTYLVPSIMALSPALPCGSPGMTLRNVKVGDHVPAFVVQALDGTAIKSESFRGKVLLLVFARPDHEKSRQALTIAQRIRRDNPDPKLAILAVATKPGTDEYFKRLAAEAGLTYPIAMDPGRNMYGDFGVVVAPTTLLIDEAGVLRFVMPHMRISHDRRLGIHLDLLLARISLEEHDKRLTQSDESKMPGQNPRTRRLGLAKTLIEQRKFEEAVPILTQLHTERGDAVVAALLGTALLELNRIDAAATYLEPLAQRKLKSPKVKVALARLELARGNAPGAESYLVDALKTAPVKGPILFQLGRLYEQQQKLDQAAVCYRQALEEVYGTSP